MHRKGSNNTEEQFYNTDKNLKIFGRNLCCDFILVLVKRPRIKSLSPVRHVVALSEARQEPV
jgi:hypothetical protein